MSKSSLRTVAIWTIASVIFLFCVRYVVNSFKWAEIFAILRTADLRWLVGIQAIAIILYWLLRTLRWFILLKNLNVNIRFIDLYMCTAVSLSFSIYTPFQSGEVLKIELLKKYSGLRRFQGYSSFVVERLIDLFVVVSMAVASILIRFDIGINRSNVVLIWAVLVVFLLVGFGLIKKIRFKGRVGEFLHDIQLSINNPGTLLAVTLLTFCSWTMIAIAFQILLHSIAINITLPEAIALTSIVTLINILSLIPGAIGVAEASSAVILIGLGLNAAFAQAGALVLRGHGIVAIVLGVLHFVIWKGLRQCGAQVNAEISKQ